MLQEYAASLGYKFVRKTVRRTSWYKHDVGLAGYRASGSKVLVEERDRQIANGQIDIGISICPISTTTFRYCSDLKTIRSSEQQTYGRKISLLKIRKLHLQQMFDKGLLRNTQTSEMDREQLLEILLQYEGMAVLQINILTPHRLPKKSLVGF